MASDFKKLEVQLAIFKSTLSSSKIGSYVIEPVVMANILQWIMSLSLRWITLQHTQMIH